MDFERFRKNALSGFIGFLSLTALIAIVAVLTDSFNAFQAKVLATTFSISAGSVCAMICAVYIERKGRAKIGMAGIVFSVASSLIVIVGVWLDVKDDTFWKVVGSFITMALSLTHLLLLQLPDLRPGHKWVQKAVYWTNGIIAAQILIGMWGEIQSELYFRAIAVVSILIGLETLVIPILLKLRGGADTGSDDSSGQKENGALHLIHVQDDMYRDATGSATYRVRKDQQPG